MTSPEVPEGDSGTTPATFTVALEPAPPAGTTVSVDYHVAGVTASVPGDVAAASGTLVFGAGEKEKQVTVQVQGDAEDEGDEAFRLALTNLAATGGRARPARREHARDDRRRRHRGGAASAAAADTVAPQTTATAAPAPNAAGWHRRT